MKVRYLWLAAALAACGTADPGTEPIGTLSSHGFFEGPLAALAPAAGVLPYEVISPLFSDHAEKSRFMVLPEGEAVTFSEDGDWTFPLGTVLIKNFAFRARRDDPGSPRRHVETRILVNEDPEWVGQVYVWDEEQQDATLYKPGRITTVRYGVGDEAPKDFPYVIPNVNQCKGCHSNRDKNQPIGPNTRQLNRSVDRDGQSLNQLDWLAAQGVFSGGLPAPNTLDALADPQGEAPVGPRARAWLEANCAHCHRPGGDGGTSGLVLAASETRPEVFGVCKSPVAAGAGTGGFLYDIVPGEPERSIMVHRIRSLDPDVKMPEIPNLQIAEFGAELVEAWIDEMSPAGCGEPGLVAGAAGGGG